MILKKQLRQSLILIRKINDKEISLFFLRIKNVIFVLIYIIIANPQEGLGFTPSPEGLCFIDFAGNINIDKN